jgi:hypothetical protein
MILREYRLVDPRAKMLEFSAVSSTVVEINENRNTLRTCLLAGSRRGRFRPNCGARCIAIGAPRTFSSVGQIYLLDDPLLHEPLSNPPICARLTVKEGVTQGWHRYIGEWGDVVGLDKSAASTQGSVLMREYRLTLENVCNGLDHPNADLHLQLVELLSFPSRTWMFAPDAGTPKPERELPI